MSQHPPSAPAPTGHRCIRCGYDLSGSTVGGACPECGTAVSNSLAANAGSGSGTSSGKATASLVLGILSLPGVGFCCVPGIILGALALAFGYSARKEIADGIASPSSAGTVTAGIVCGWIGLALGLIATIGYGFMVLLSASVR